jgi:hypothetical protein
MHLLLSELGGGLSAASTTLATELPRAVSMLRQRIKSLVQGRKISLCIDGGASRLAFGRKVVVVVATSVELDFDILLDVKVFEAHETGASNAQQVKEVCELYSIDPMNVVFIGADNASLNALMVRLLNEQGFQAIYARCLPHTLTLVVKAFLDCLNASFKFDSHLKMLRGLITAGGGAGKKLLAIEYGLSVSSIDFVDTRWASLVKSILYVANEQRDVDMKAARARLQELADKGDASAREALDDDEAPSMVFNVLYWFVESLSEDELARRDASRDGVENVELSLVKSKKKLLSFFSSLTTFAGFQLVDIIFGVEGGSLPGIMTLAQGSAGYEAKLTSRITGEVPSVIVLVRTLMLQLEKLHAEEDSDDVTKGNVAAALDAIRAELLARLKVQARVVVQKSRQFKEMFDKDVEWDEDKFDDAVPAFMQRQEALYPKVLDSVMAQLKKAAAAVHNCEGLKKLNECLDGLELSQRFNLNNKPTSFDNDNDILRHLGLESNFPRRLLFIAGWRAHVAAWRKPAQHLPPEEVYARWKARAEDPNPSLAALGLYAQVQLLRPMSAASCERIFSYLSHMDAPDRMTMMPVTLQGSLLLRGNWGILHQMVEEDHAMEVGAAAGVKRRRVQGLAAAAAAKAAAADAAREEEEARRKAAADAASDSE